MSNHLELPQLTSNQANKETTVNDQAAALDAALTDSKSIDVEDADVTLTDAQALRAMLITATGAPGTARNIVVPDNKKLYVLKNDADDVVTIKTSGGTGVEVEAGKTAITYCDDTNVISLSSVIAALSDIGDVNAGSPSDNDLLRWVAGSNEWQNVAIATMLALASIGALSDVDLSGITSGQSLVWDGSSLVAGAVAGNASACSTTTARRTVPRPTSRSRPSPPARSWCSSTACCRTKTITRWSRPPCRLPRHLPPART